MLLPVSTRKGVVEVHAVRLGDFAVHRSLNRYGKTMPYRYTLTHIHTGLAVVQYAPSLVHISNCLDEVRALPLDFTTMKQAPRKADFEFTDRRKIKNFHMRWTVRQTHWIGEIVL